MERILNDLREKKPVSNPNDFIHDFLLILDEPPGLLTSETATPPSAPLALHGSVFLGQGLGACHRSAHLSKTRPEDFHQAEQSNCAEKPAGGTRVMESSDLEGC